MRHWIMVMGQVVRLSVKINDTIYHFTAPCYSNGAVLPSYDVRPSVRNVGERWSHTLS